MNQLSMYRAACIMHLMHWNHRDKSLGKTKTKYKYKIRRLLSHDLLVSFSLFLARWHDLERPKDRREPGRIGRCQVLFHH